MGKRPSWKKTIVPWKKEIAIWRQMALGLTDSQIRVWLNLKGDDSDRDTIRKVRQELRDYPEELVHKLPKEVQIYWKDRQKQLGRPVATDVSSVSNKDESHIQEKEYEFRQSQQHKDLLKKELEKIRACLRDPRLYELPDKRELLEVEGKDWRLDPKMWFYLCTPDFSDLRKWGYAFPLVEKEIKESIFWEHYWQLWDAVEQLENDYGVAAAKLSRDYEEFREPWIKIKVEKAMREQDPQLKPSRYPDALEEDLVQFEPSYDREYCNSVMEKLAMIIDNLPIRLLDLEKKLEQLNRDLVLY